MWGRTLEACRGSASGASYSYPACGRRVRSSRCRARSECACADAPALLGLPRDRSDPLPTLRTAFTSGVRVTCPCRSQASRQHFQTMRRTSSRWCPSWLPSPHLPHRWLGPSRRPATGRQFGWQGRFSQRDRVGGDVPPKIVSVGRRSSAPCVPRQGDTRQRRHK